MIPEIDKIEKRLTALQEERDRVIGLSREVVRLAARGITMMHSGRMRDAEYSIKSLNTLVKRLRKMEKGNEYYSQQAHQEYVEASALYAILTKGRLPARSELGVAEIPYLLGLLDLVGELKREAFEELRKGGYKRADFYYRFMVGIHDSLLPLRFSSSLINDFRKKQDVARIQLESLSSELLAYGSRNKIR